jgi:hypothetical protein
MFFIALVKENTSPPPYGGSKQGTQRLHVTPLLVTDSVHISICGFSHCRNDILDGNSKKKGQKRKKKTWQLHFLPYPFSAAVSSCFVTIHKICYPFRRDFEVASEVKFITRKKMSYCTEIREKYFTNKAVDTKTP